MGRTNHHYGSKYVSARKPYTCACCSVAILTGERHLYFVARDVLRICERCSLRAGHDDRPLYPCAAVSAAMTRHLIMSTHARRE